MKANRQRRDLSRFEQVDLGHQTRIFVYSLCYS